MQGVERKHPGLRDFKKVIKGFFLGRTW